MHIYLAQSQPSYNAIRVYLSTICHLQLTTGLLNTFNAHSTPCLAQVLQGISRHQASTMPPTTQLPITIQIMQSIKAALTCNSTDPQNIMMWAACCVYFFSCLHCSEFMVPSQTSYDPRIHLSCNDLLGSKVQPNMVLLQIKQSKTNPIGQGNVVSLGLTGQDICPVKALLPYLVARGAQPSSSHNSWCTLPYSIIRLIITALSARAHWTRYRTFQDP